MVALNGRGQAPPLPKIGFGMYFRSKRESITDNLVMSIFVLVIFTLVVFATVVGLIGCQREGSITSNTRKPVDDSYPFFIMNLRQKDFGGSDIKIVRTLEENEDFTSYLITYNSEGLQIIGMMNVPKGKGPFPAIILNHGHYDPKRFTIGYGFKDAADFFARSGYIAIGSNYRNYGDSDRGSDSFIYNGSLYDVLYLVNAVKRLSYVDPERIGMWGHSGGGGLTLKSIVVNSSIKAAALYASMSADDVDNYNVMKKWHPHEIKEFTDKMGSPKGNPEVFAKMSPINYLSDLNAPVIIHHGERDQAVPISWSEKLRNTLIKEGKKVEYYSYPNQEHTLEGKARNEAMERTLTFFNRYVKGSAKN